MEKQNIRCSCCFRIKPDSGRCPHCGCDETTRNSPHQLPIGTVLHEQYQIGRVLGQGGFGITYHGWDLYLDIPVAIKEYYPTGMVMRESMTTLSVSDISGDNGERFSNNRDRFMREAKLLARFSDVREVVQVKNFFLTNNTAYIVMEYVEGITLTEYVNSRGGKLTPKETFGIFGPIIQTMAKVHKTGIIHRDIKPGNIMMVPGGAKMLDFGAGRDMTGSTTGNDPSRTTEAIVTHGYAAFEQYQRRGLGSWTDVYALCATMYYCMTGEVPPDSPGRVLDDEKLDFGAIEGLTPTQIGALIHGTELRPDKRTPTMEQLYQELFADEAKRQAEEEYRLQKLAEEKIEREREQQEAIRREREIRKEVPVYDKTQMADSGTKGKESQPRKNKKSKLLQIGVIALVLVSLAIAVMIGFGQTADDSANTQVHTNGKLVSGKCGVTSSWELNLETGVMQISGIRMSDFYLEHYDENGRQDKVARPWEDYTDKIKEVVFEDTIQNVGTAAFHQCPVTKVTFGSDLLVIGHEAFSDTQITEVEFPDRLTEIGAWAFVNTKLKAVSLPASLKYLYTGAFAECAELERVFFNGEPIISFDFENTSPIFSRFGGVTEEITVSGPSGGALEDYCGVVGAGFESNGSTTEYEAQGDFSDYPGNVNGSWYFDHQSQYLRIEGEMPTDMMGRWEMETNQVSPDRKHVPLSPWAPFTDSIHTVYIADGVTRICDNAFNDCINLRDVRLPNTLQSIGFQAFLGSSIDEIYIPDSVTFIDSFAFNHCVNLQEVKLPMGLEVLQPSVFNVTPNLHRVYAGNGTVFECTVRDGQEVTPFNSITQGGHSEIDENALPQNVTVVTPQGQFYGKKSSAREFAESHGWNYESGLFGYLGAERFGDCMPGDSSVRWAVENGVLRIMGNGQTPFYRASAEDYQIAMDEGGYTTEEDAPWYPYHNDIFWVYIEPGITSLNRGALRDMPYLDHINFGGVERLHHGAIDNCGIQYIELPESVDTILSQAIQNCTELKFIWIYGGRECIEDGAFEGCVNVGEIRFFSGEEALNVRGNLFGKAAPKDLTIWGLPGSNAEKQAKNNRIPFKIKN